MERLGLADGCPVGLGSHYFSAARFPDLLEALKATDTITAALARVGVGRLPSQSTRVTARLPQDARQSCCRSHANARFW